jgi:hypothetical protein
MQTQPWNRPLTGPLTSFSAVEPQLQTYDLVLWCGGGNLSRFIQLGTQSCWSHVGLVVRAGEFVMLYESTIGEGHSGVRTSLLKSSIGGKCAVRQLQGLSEERRAAADDGLNKVMQELEGRPFEQNLKEFVLAGYDGPFGQNASDLTSLFCAELVAEALQRSGILLPQLPSNEYTPADFGDDAGQPPLLAEGLSYAGETYLQPDPRYRAQMFGREAVKLSSRVSRLFAG